MRDGWLQNIAHSLSLMPSILHPTWHGCILTYAIHRRPCKRICHDTFITQHHGTVASRERSDDTLKLSTAGGTTWTLLSCAVNCCCKWSCAGTARITSYARKSHVRRWEITRVVGDGQNMLHDVFVAAGAYQVPHNITA